MEPLTFKGREGSGQHGRPLRLCGRVSDSREDWQKYDLYYRVWGRKLYNPDAEPETWQRALRAEFGHGAMPTETALSNASRILALMTSAHLPSASNHALWYEMPDEYAHRFGQRAFALWRYAGAETLWHSEPARSTDVFHGRGIRAGAHCAQRTSAKYSPIDVAQWVEDCVRTSRDALDQARRTAKSPGAAAFRRIEEDVLIQIGLGSFFAHKLRSGVLYAIFVTQGDPEAGSLALEHYQKARDAWAAMAERAKGVYRADVSYGSIPKRRGHWSDRLPDIDVDLAAMKSKVQANPAFEGPRISVVDEIRAATGRPQQPVVKCSHLPPESFTPGRMLSLSLAVSGGGGGASVSSVRLYYRHVNQAERWSVMEVSRENGVYAAAIPADYTQSPYPLQYYFELEDDRGRAWMYPGFNATLSNQPYFAVWKRSA